MWLCSLQNRSNNDSDFKTLRLFPILQQCVSCYIKHLVNTVSSTDDIHPSVGKIDAFGFWLIIPVAATARLLAQI